MITTPTQSVFDETLTWPPVEKARLIEALLASFDLNARKKIDAEWARESESRIDAYEAGKIHSVSVDEVFSRINKQ